MHTIAFFLSTMLLGLNPYPEPKELVVPEFPGGQSAMTDYFADYIEYPVSARESGVEGAVTVSFIVERSGSITNPEIVKGIHPECDAAAKNAVLLMPKWKPARYNGEIVRSKTAVRVVFRLD